MNTILSVVPWMATLFFFFLINPSTERSCPPSRCLQLQNSLVLPHRDGGSGETHRPSAPAARPGLGAADRQSRGTVAGVRPGGGQLRLLPHGSTEIAPRPSSDSDRVADCVF